MFNKKFCIFLSFLFLLPSCSSQKKEARPKTIRFVDSKGQETFLRRRVPEFNKEQLSKQQMSDPNIRIMNGNVDYNQNNLPEELFADKTAQNQNDYVQYDTQKSGNNDEFIFKPTKQEEKLKQNLAQKKTQNKQTRTTQKSSPTQRSRKTTAVSQTSSQSNVFYIQIGAYKFKKNAYEGLQKYSSVNKGLVKSYKSKNGNLIYRTLLGPYNTRLQAESDLEKVIQKGHYDVYITRK